MFAPQAIDVPTNIWKMTFYTPEEKIMLLREAQKAGYGAMSTPSRLVMRSPYNTAETYSEDVSPSNQHFTTFVLVFDVATECLSY